MLFNSIEFLVFLPAVLLMYGLFRPIRTPLLILASYFFYSWWNWPYLGLIITSTIIDFICARQLEKRTERSSRQLLLGVSLLSNLGLLFFFKYFNFLNAQANHLFDILGMDYLIPYSSFILPMGISFYTFQTIGYTIDVYQRRIKAEQNLLNFALYVSFFPQLVAGPIERAGHLLEQLKRNQDLKINHFTEGLARALFGLFKKVVIADRLALFVNQVYNDPTTYDGSILIIATVFFAFQIYCDFSGYSDIAIGVAKMFGVDLMENFRNPYLANNIRAFWSRWHISLSTWFRDYLYIPLGGNKNGFYKNILIVFILSGLWHGANWTFIVWGGLHGGYLLLTVGILKIFPYLTKKEYSIPGKILTFGLVTFSWIFFRANSIQDAWFIVSNLGNIQTLYVFDLLYQAKIGLSDLSNWLDPINLAYGRIYFQFTIGDLLLTFMLLPLLLISEYWIHTKPVRLVKMYNRIRFVYYFVLMMAIVFLGVFSNTQFIYFQF